MKKTILLLILSLFLAAGPSGAQFFGNSNYVRNEGVVVGTVGNFAFTLAVPGDTIRWECGGAPCVGGAVEIGNTIRVYGHLDSTSSCVFDPPCSFPVADYIYLLQTPQ